MNLISERLDDLRALELYFSKGNKKPVIDSSVFNEYYFKIKRILKNDQNKLRENFSNSVQNGFRKKNKSTKHNRNSKILGRNNSDDFEENNLRRMAKYNTGKVHDFTGIDKTRQSYFRLSLYNQSIKKVRTSMNFNQIKVINEGNKADDN